MASPIALTAPQLNDLVQDTLKDLGKPNFTEIVTPYQDHIVFRQLLKTNRIMLQSGRGIQWNVMVNPVQAAANVGFGASDQVDIEDTMTQAAADWRNTTANYAVIGQELDMNAEPSRIVDLIKERRIAAMIALAELMESNFWSVPVASNDDLTPWGINTWLQKSATEGFNGGMPAGYTSIGLSTTTYPNWQNWTYQYTAVSRDDLIRHWRKAADFTNFKPPVDGIPTFNTGDQYGFYTNYAVYGPLAEALDSQNDNLGNELDKYSGGIMFRGVPVTWVPRLETDTTNTLYGINWGWFKTIILRNWWLRETHIPVYPGQHTLSAHFLDCTYQWVMRNRRVCFVISTGTTYPG
jgi:hypothetical protein